MASAGNNKLHDSHHEIKENYPYEMKMKHQRIMPGRASNGNVAVGKRLDFYNDHGTAPGWMIRLQQR